jgi:peptidyl-prolyl cis-trans isomerase A (cyclophilin A)
MSMSRLILWGGLLGLVIVGCTGSRTVSQKSNSTDDTAEAAASTEIQQVAGSDQQTYLVRLETSKGDVLIEVHPEWAPRASKRFRELVEIGFYDDCRFFRVLEGFMAQVGMNGDPALNKEWKDKKFRDDPVIQSNKRGFVTFATSGPDSRTTQFFINMADNSTLDRRGFSPFGKVLEGQEIVESLHNGYKEDPQQDRIDRRGNAYLKSEFPKLDYIVRATVEER